MSKYRTCFRLCEECIVDDNGNITKSYEKNFPHHDIIAKEMTESFNNAKLERFVDDSLKGKIKSIRMRIDQDNEGYSVGHITFEGIPGLRMTQKVKETLDDDMSAQFSDGWGEGFLGIINIMKAPDGTEFFVE